MAGKAVDATHVAPVGQAGTGPLLDESAPPVVHPGSHAPAGAAGDPRALLPYVDDLADMKATAFASELMMEQRSIDGRGHHAFLNTLDRIDDPLLRRKVKEKYEAFTHEKLEDFIAHAHWAGSRDKDQALSLVSGQRDEAEAKIAGMTPERRAQIHADASRWAEQVLAVTRIEGANDDDNAKKIANVLGPRTAEEIEAIRAAVRVNTRGEHSIYEELDRSLSKGNEDEAIAGLSGDPVHAVQVGLANASGDPVRVKELLRGLKGPQLAELRRRNPMIVAQVGALVDAGADRGEIEALAAGRKDKADGERIASLFQAPEAGGRLSGTNLSDETKRNMEDRKPANIIKELEGESPAELIAAEQAWDSDPAHAGRSFKAMIEARFGSAPSTDKLRIEALLSGDRVSDKTYELREGMRTHDQETIEDALSNPALKSSDRAKQSEAMKQRDAIGARAAALDAGGHDVATQLDASYRDAVERPRLEGNMFDQLTTLVAPDATRERRQAQANESRTAAQEMLDTGALSIETQVYRAKSKGDALGESQLVDGIATNKDRDDAERRYAARYQEEMIATPDLARFESGAQLAKWQGDQRSMEDIERDRARSDMTAPQLRIENVREYGVAPERAPDVEHRLQNELGERQHSNALDTQEQMRGMLYNVGTEDLVREQRGAADDMFGPAKDAYGFAPRDLKPGVTAAEFRQLDQNRTTTLEAQREEKTKLANQVARIYTTIMKLAALVAGQPELVAAIDALSGLGAIAIKKQIAGEAYDPTIDAKLLAITAMVDVATVGIARVGGGSAVTAGEEAASESWKTGANFAVMAGGTAATGVVEGRSPKEILEDVLKSGLTQFLPAGIGRRMQEALGDATKARVILGQLMGIGGEVGTNYAINGSIEEALLVTGGMRANTYLTGGLPSVRARRPKETVEAAIEFPLLEPRMSPRELRSLEKVPAPSPYEIESPTDKQVREYYNGRSRDIARQNEEWKSEGLSVEQRARMASQARHGLRMDGREVMESDIDTLGLLVRDAQKYGDGGGPTFDQLVEMQRARGVEGDEAYEAIIEASQRTDPETNARVANGEPTKIDASLPPGTTVHGDHIIVTGTHGRDLVVRVRRRDSGGPVEIRYQPDGSFELSVGKEIPAEVAVKQAASELTKMAETPRQNSNDLGDLYKQAAVAQKDLGDLTRGIATDMKVTALVPENLKGRPRTEEKIAADYDGENARIVDLARSSIVCDTPEQVKEVIARIKDKVEVVRTKDRFEKPDNGYRDVMMNVRMPNGHIVEIQIHLKSILDVKNGPGHALYEQIRSIDARVKREKREETFDELHEVERLEAEMKRLYDNAFASSPSEGGEGR